MMGFEFNKEAIRLWEMLKKAVLGHYYHNKR